MRLHFNKSNGIFSVRREDRSTVAASERHGKIPRIGDTFE
ncbi:BC10 family protein, partial [Flammeovirga agarivorans]|nr:BC10 family protein [Flammeovirga agarivorans]